MWSTGTRYQVAFPKTPMRLSLLLLPLLCQLCLCDDATQLCGSLEAQTSCGQCIKQHPECAWCRDPHSTEQKRCQVRSAFKTETCNPSYVYSPVTEIRIGPHNMPLGSPGSGKSIVQLEPQQNMPLGSPGSGKSIVQLEPQQVVLRMKPGDTLIVPYKYLHRKPPAGYDVKDFLVQTSEYKKLGINLQFLVDCNGKETETKQCSAIKEGQKINFKIKVTLMDCRDGADVAISVGVYGYTTVSALYITPLCGCECEKPSQQEKNSPLCHQHGNLICGQCVCESTRGGDRCECPLASYGVKNALELEDRCREKPGAPICSGKGLCRCGQCQCNLQTISGRFCQCDHLSCPTGADGRQCSGNGVCECGTCRCEEGWERDDCSCSTDKGTCMEGGTECSGNGHCECGKCVCDEGFNGATCGIADEVVTAAPTEPEEAIEEEPTETAEADLKEDEMAEADDKIDAGAADDTIPEATESDYSAPEPGTPEEAKSSAPAVLVSLVFVSIASMLI
ncbi:EGF-like domain protein [Ostertagia ostertagi]